MSARSVARGLNGLVLRHEGSRYRFRNGDVILNWGASATPSGLPITLNQPEAVRICTSKKRTYKALAAAEIPTVEWTISPDEAVNWLNLGSRVFHRSLDTGARGQGITLLEPNTSTTDLPQGGFFTKRINSAREFRVYVFGTVVTTVLEKRKRNGTEVNPYIRSHGNGWVFCRELRAPIPDDFKATCVKAIHALGLDFGGLDVLLNREGKAHVLEINSAPGITGTALQEFCSAVKERIYGTTL
jgi:glutathione synthase/RimK-type ligase-like ATP-grasp enzyme